MAADLFKYLSSKMDEHCRDHVTNKMEIQEGEEDFEKELESHKRLMDLVLWWEQKDVQVAYHMKIPRTTLRRFGYSYEQLDEELSREGIEGGYPY